MNKLWKYTLNYGRSGDLECLFIETEEEVKKYIGKHVYFGEVLGKHSEVDADLELSDFKMITDNQEVINHLVEKCGKTIVGINPIETIKDSEDDNV